ncbi:hypothetical protein BS78_04G041500 [Paspalum vaginatum]|nr:hypothetical protein BS78_04G041500 [Paspalum vaginatum]
MMMPRDDDHETSPRAKRSRMTTLGQPPPQLNDDLFFDEILTRVPPAAAARCRSVCRAWNAALTSAGFLRAYADRARSAAAREPELLFLVPAAAGISLYTCTLRIGDEAPRAAQELLTVGNLSADHVALMSPRPCHGLTLILDARPHEASASSGYYVCNLSTGQHVALPPCERAAGSESAMAPGRTRNGNRMQCRPWDRYEISSVGLGFDPATGTHKVARLFRRRMGKTVCEVCAPAADSGGWRWRPCAGRVPPPAASFVAGLPPVFVGGSLYWLVELSSFTSAVQPIMSFSVGAEQFGWVSTPPLLARRIDALAVLDGSVCAIADFRVDSERYGIFTWNGGNSNSWSMRCSINLQSLPQQISDEFLEEQHVLPLCSAAGGKILLATDSHKVFAYDPERVTMERVFYTKEFVDVPGGHRNAPLLLHVGLHEQSLVSVVQQQQPTPPSSRLQVKLGSDTVGKRQVSDEYRSSLVNFNRGLRNLFKDLARRQRRNTNNGAWAVSRARVQAGSSPLVRKSR